MRDNRLKGILAILFVAICYGLSPILVTWGNYVIKGEGQVAIRALLTGFFLFLYILSTKGQWKLASLHKSKGWFAWYLFALPVGQILYVISVLTGGIDAGPASLFYLNASKVVFTFLLKAIVLKEVRPTVGRSSIILLAVSAMVLYAWPSPLFFSVPMLAAMGTGLIEAISSIAMGKLDKNDNQYTLACVRYSTSGILLPIVLPLINQPVVFQNNMTQVALLLGIGGLILSGLSQAFVGKLELFAYNNIAEDLANVLVTTELVWGVVLSYVLLQNRLTIVQISGIALLMISSIFAGLLASREKVSK